MRRVESRASVPVGGKLEGEIIMAEPISRRYAHSEGITHLCYDSKK